MREAMINFLEYLYKSDLYEPEMDDILISYGASENTESSEGFYASMSESQLLSAVTSFYTRYKKLKPEIVYLFYLIRTQKGFNLDYDSIYIEAFRDGYSLAGKDYTKLDEILGL